MCSETGAKGNAQCRSHRNNRKGKHDSLRHASYTLAIALTSPLSSICRTPLLHTNCPSTSGDASVNSVGEDTSVNFRCFPKCISAYDSSPVYKFPVVTKQKTSVDPSLVAVNPQAFPEGKPRIRFKSRIHGVFPNLEDPKTVQIPIDVTIGVNDGKGREREFQINQNLTADKATFVKVQTDVPQSPSLLPKEDLDAEDPMELADEIASHPAPKKIPAIAPSVNPVENQMTFLNDNPTATTQTKKEEPLLASSENKPVTSHIDDVALDSDAALQQPQSSAVMDPVVITPTPSPAPIPIFISPSVVKPHYIKMPSVSPAGNTFWPVLIGSGLGLAGALIAGAAVYVWLQKEPLENTTEAILTSGLIRCDHGDHQCTCRYCSLCALRQPCACPCHGYAATATCFPMNTTTEPPLVLPFHPTLKAQPAACSRPIREVVFRLSPS